VASPFDLSRFVLAQDSGGTYERALAELVAGRKQSHWMWFVFPQLAGLGHSEMSRRYAIRSREEAEAYLADPLLGKRLEHCAVALLTHEGIGASTIMGAVDAFKLRSSMTLFAEISPRPSAYRRVLERYFGGAPDPATVELLARQMGAA
jgi:uncharacterized protein (DUF1810 family)